MPASQHDSRSGVRGWRAATRPSGPQQRCFVLGLPPCEGCAERSPPALLARGPAAPRLRRPCRSAPHRTSARRRLRARVRRPRAAAASQLVSTNNSVRPHASKDAALLLFRKACFVSESDKNAGTISAEAARIGFDSMRAHLLQPNVRKGWRFDVMLHTWDRSLVEQLVAITQPVAFGVAGDNGLIDGYGLPDSVENALTDASCLPRARLQFERPCVTRRSQARCSRLLLRWLVVVLALRIFRHSRMDAFGAAVLGPVLRCKFIRRIVAVGRPLHCGRADFVAQVFVAPLPRASLGFGGRCVAARHALTSVRECSAQSREWRG